MKKYLPLIIALLCCLVLCACGSKQESAESTATSTQDEMTSTLPGADLESSSNELSEEDAAYVLAESFIDKPVEDLIAAVGEPISREYSSSCLGDGEDGNLEYNGFYVFTYKEGDSETVKQVYR